ncbi:glycosyltransferase family 2 protein [Desulforhabdus sp. TSK]|uniref:glycosyltransferase family 2 protein n=1 Tax=Desulforhabdus sp. TSK TaxID=2925014 RepID=UPI001FC8A7D3|nr:glycosyltransferase family 2 protein [Desulforhabdus sp. TSK]GKT09360.1 putative glycosyltransferase YkoT [Desulforhabdus sp. TSK]
MDTSLKLSIVIPCYNEEQVIEETNRRLQQLLEGWIRTALITHYEIIYVNDGSRDSTLKKLKELANRNQNIKIISFSNNFGHQAALTAGLYHATGDAAVSLDADLQDPPEVIEEMIQAYRSGSEIVYGVRKERKTDTFFKRATALAFYKLMLFMGVNCFYNHGDCRLLSQRVLREFKKYEEINRFIRGIIPLMGFNYSIVEYDREKRYAGETKYPLRKMISLAIEGITSFSSVPLRIASLLGFMIFIGTLLLSIWVLIVTLGHASVPGWASTVLPVYFLGGIQLIFFGILGEYIGKIYMEVKKRPLFIIKEKFNFED